MTKKAIIFDVDGTIMPIGRDQEFLLPSERLKKVIKKLEGEYLISMATGRNLQYAEHIINFLELNGKCVLSGGTEIYSPTTKKMVWRAIIPETTFGAIISALSDCNAEVFNQDKFVVGVSGKTVKKLLNSQTTVVYVLAVEPEEAEELVSKLQHPELTVINMESFQSPSLRDIHIHSKDASKEHAVKELLKIEGIDKNDCIVVGDGLNDFHLFRAGGTKIAMGNADIELKKQADIVIGDVDNDGLAEYLESL